MQAKTPFIPVGSSPRVAELENLLENIFRSVNIALVNEIAGLCDRMGEVNMWEVVEAAATKPFGFMPFYVVEAIQRVLTDRGSQSAIGSRVLILGAAFKKM